MKILKPSTRPVTVSIRVPAELAQRLATARAAAAQRGLLLDIDHPLAKALSRLLRAAEAELHTNNPPLSVAKETPNDQY